MQNLFPAVCIALVAAALPQGAGAQISDFSFFEEALAPHGDWLQVERYGPVWKPDVEEGWAPYTVGNWAYTDAGWTWISHEPFGSIVFHYGRWLLTDVGWCWVPGSDWGPAWVSWRVSGETIGWAPLPPEAVWHSKHGIGYWVDVHTEIGPAYYRFCGVRDFCSPVVSSVLFRPSRNLKIMLETHNVTNIVDNGRGVFCGGPQYRWVRDASGFEVPVLRLVREENVRHYYGLRVGGEYGAAMGFVFEDMLVLPGPQRVELGDSYRNRRVQPVTVSFSKGWYGDTSANERLRSHYDREWEARQSGQSRGMAALGARSAEVRIQVVTNQEKQVAFAEAANRGNALNSNVIVPGFAENEGRRSVQSRSQTTQVPSSPTVAPASQGAAPSAVQRALPVSPQSPAVAPAQTVAPSSPRIAPAPVFPASRSSSVSGVGVPVGVSNTGVGGSAPAGSLPSSSSQTFTRPLPPAQVPSPAPGAPPSYVAQPPTAGTAGVGSGATQTFPIRKRTDPLPQTQPLPTTSGVQSSSTVTGTSRQTTGLVQQPLLQFAPLPQPGVTQPGVSGGGSVPSVQRRSMSQPQVQAPVQPTPSSGASFSVIPAPAPVTRAPAQPSGFLPQAAPQTQPFSRGATQASVPGGPASRPSAPGAAAAPASSEAALSTVPASSPQGQIPVTKKKPGDPGYVPTPQ